MAASSLRTQIKPSPIPQHVAIIMDGNGRWAKKKGVSRAKGHEQGALNISELLDSSLEMGISVVSLYSFSTENWNRPQLEIKAIFQLLERFIVERLDEFKKKGVKILVSGDISPLPASTQKLIERSLNETHNNHRITANFCLNYGSRNEIYRAVNLIMRERLMSAQKLNGAYPDSVLSPIKPEEFEKHLYTHGLPEVDLMVRTAGELRLSNFLLYQCAYAEFYFTDVLWPDFNEEELYRSIIAFQKRERKFGGLNERN